MKTDIGMRDKMRRGRNPLGAEGGFRGIFTVFEKLVSQAADKTARAKHAFVSLYYPAGFVILRERERGVILWQGQ